MFLSKKRITITLLTLAGLTQLGMTTRATAQTNIDPTNKFAWSENIGWTNWRDANAGAQGAVVGFTFMTGFLWGENVGWINFSPATAGVTIDPATGDFSGRAWGENIGWITFASTSPVPFKVATGWSCDEAQGAPGGSMATIFLPGSDDTLIWQALAGATGYDVVKGDVATLIATSGDFSQATTMCRQENRTSTILTIPDVPSLGQILWYLVRGVNCVEAITGSHGTYDTGAVSQVGLRDAEIAASGNDCR